MFDYGDYVEEMGMRKGRREGKREGIISLKNLIKNVCRGVEEVKVQKKLGLRLDIFEKFYVRKTIGA